MVKWKIGLGIYCALVIYVSSMSPGELPRTEVAVSDKVIHLVEYAIMGILAWGAFGKARGGVVSPGAYWLFASVLGLPMSAGRTGWEAGVRRKCGMRRPMRPVPLSGCSSRWFSGSADQFIKATA